MSETHEAGRRPTDTPQFSSVADALRFARRYLDEHIALPEGASTVLTLWAAFTYHRDTFETSPLLAFTAGSPRSGKSTALRAVGLLADKPFSSSNATPAALFRIIDARKPTLLLDEAEHYFKGSGDMAAILNAGFYKADAYVARADQKHPKKFHEYYVFTPRAFAMNGTPWGTLADRSIIIPMRRGKPAKRFLYIQAGNDLAPVRAALEEWEPELNLAPTLPDYLEDRAWERWYPLFSIAEALGPEWVHDLRGAIMALDLSGGGERPGLGETALLHIKVLFDRSDAEAMAPGEMVKRLVENFPDVWEGKDQLTPKGLAGLLKNFQVRPEGTVRARKGDEATFAALGGKDRSRAYTRQAFEEAWRAYVRPEDVRALLEEPIGVAAE